MLKSCCRDRRGITEFPEEEITKTSLYSRSSESCSAADRFWAFHQHSRLGYSWNLLGILLIRMSVQCFCKRKNFLSR